MKELLRLFEKDILEGGFTKREMAVWGVGYPLLMLLFVGLAGLLS